MQLFLWILISICFFSIGSNALNECDYSEYGDAGIYFWNNAEIQDKLSVYR